MRFLLFIFTLSFLLSSNAQRDTIKIDFLPYLRSCMFLKDSTSYSQKVNDTLSITYYKFYVRSISTSTPYTLKFIYVIAYGTDIPDDDYKFKKDYWWTLRRTKYNHEGIPIYQHSGNW